MVPNALLNADAVTDRGEAAKGGEGGEESRFRRTKRGVRRSRVTRRRRDVGGRKSRRWSVY